MSPLSVRECHSTAINISLVTPRFWENWLFLDSVSDGLFFLHLVPIVRLNMNYKNIKCDAVNNIQPLSRNNKLSTEH